MPAPKKRRLSQCFSKGGKESSDDRLLGVENGELSKVHVCSCFLPQPSGVTNLAFEEVSQTLCVARQNGSLEFYRLVTLNSLVQEDQEQGTPLKQDSPKRQNAPLYHLHFLKATPSVDGWYASRVVWISPNRLLTAGLSAAIVEWDLAQLMPKGTATSSYGGAVWDLVRDSTKPVIAAACDDGQGRVFELDSDTQELTLRCALGKKPGARATSILFSKYGPQPSGSLLFIGHDTSVVSCHIWGTREEKWNTILTNRWSDEEHVIVWCMVELPTDRIVVGTSNGDVQFLNITNGIKLSLITTHAADILTMIYVPDVTNTLYVSGCDNRLIRLTQNTVYEHSNRRSQREHWGETLHMTSHRCDVTSLISVNLSREESSDYRGDEKRGAEFTASDEGRLSRNVLLLSGSLDCAVNLYRHMGLSRLFYEQYESNNYLLPSVRHASLTEFKRDLLLYQNGNTLQLWGVVVTSSITAESHLPVSVPTLLIDLLVQGRYHIVSSDITADGQWVAYSTATRVIVLQLTCTMQKFQDDSPAKRNAKQAHKRERISPECKKLNAHFRPYQNQVVLKELGGVRIMRFLRTSPFCCLCMVDSFNRLCVLHLETQSKSSFALSADFLSEPATLLELSVSAAQEKQLACVGNRCGNLFLYEIETTEDCKIKEFAKLPRFYQHVVSVTFLPFSTSQMLLVTGLVEACVWNIQQRHLRWRIQLVGPQTLPMKDRDSSLWSRPDSLLLGATALAHPSSEGSCVDIMFHSQRSIDMVKLDEDASTTTSSAEFPNKTIYLHKVNQNSGEESTGAAATPDLSKPTYLNLLARANASLMSTPQPPESSFNKATSGVVETEGGKRLPLCISRRYPICDDASAILAVIWLSDGNLLVSTIYRKIHWAVIPNCVWRRRYAT